MQKFFLLILVIVFSLTSNAQADQLIVKSSEKGLYLEHTVLAKEGLYLIGRLYNVNARSIAAYNGMELNQGIEIDQVLRIPLTDTNFTQKATSGTPVYYEVVSGDGLLKVANVNNKVALKSLRDWNALTSDNIQEGSRLIVGFLISKEMVAVMANNRAKKLQAKKEEEKKAMVAEPVVTAKTEVVEEKKKDEPKPLQAVAKEEVKPMVASDYGYFRGSFDQQVKTKPITKNATVTSGIFKTASGWQDAKYYMLMDGVSPGTIIKVINPGNNKTVYAKVLGEMNGIRQNQGLDIRISNAAASALKISEEDKFVVKVNY
jgi:LysM repeat protein